MYRFVLFCLFFILFEIDRSIGIFILTSNYPNECLVEIETEKGIEQCGNLLCDQVKNPTEILRVHHNGQLCFIHYLKLFFSTYDQFLIFNEQQYSRHRFLHQYFPEKRNKLTVLHVIFLLRSERSSLSLSLFIRFS